MFEKRRGGGEGGGGEELSVRSPSVRGSISHAPAQLRLARTHERIEIEIEIDFPVTGVGQAGLALI